MLEEKFLRRMHYGNIPPQLPALRECFREETEDGKLLSEWSREKYFYALASILLTLALVAGYVSGGNPIHF